MSQERLTRRRWSVARQNSARSLSCVDGTIMPLSGIHNGEIAGNSEAGRPRTWTGCPSAAESNPGRSDGSRLDRSCQGAGSKPRPCSLIGCAAYWTGSAIAGFQFEFLQQLPSPRLVRLHRIDILRARHQKFIAPRAYIRPPSASFVPRPVSPHSIRTPSPSPAGRDSPSPLQPLRPPIPS